MGVRFAEEQESNESSQSNKQRYEKQQKQRQKIMMNDFLFSYDDDILSEEINLQQQSPYLQIPTQLKSSISKKNKIKSSSFVNVKSADNSPKSDDKSQHHQRRGSQQINFISYPKIQFDKNFELEVKNEGDSMPQSENNTSENESQICQSFQEEEGLENSQIQTLKRKQSKKIFNSSQSSSSSSEEKSGNREINMKKQDSIIRNNIKENVEFFLDKARGHQSTPNRRYINNQGVRRYLDPVNIVFFFQYYLFKNQKENLNTLYNLIQQLTEKEIKLLRRIQEGSTEINQNIWNDINQIKQAFISNEEKLDVIVRKIFHENIQCIFESSVIYLYLEEFKQVQDHIEVQLFQKYTFSLKKEIIEKLLNLENEQYVKIIYFGNYILENELSVDFLQMFQSNFSPKKFGNKMTLGPTIMVFYYSVEFLSPKMIREVFQKIIAKKQEMENDIIQLCLQSSNYDFLFCYYEITRTKIAGWLEDGDNQKQLVRSLGRSTGLNFQAVLFFIRKVKLWSQKNLIHLMAETLSERLDASNNDTNFLFTFSNPLKVIVLILEILQQTMKNEAFHKNICQRTKQKYSHFAKTLIKTAIDEEQMYQLMIDWDLEGRKLLYIIYDNSFQDLLAEEKVQDVIEILWNGNSNSTINMFNQFSIIQNLFYSQPKKFLKDQEKMHFTLQKSYQKEDFLGRMSVWIKQIKFRYFIDQIQISAIMICFLAYFLDNFSIFTEGFVPINPNPQIVEQTMSKLQDNLTNWIVVPLFIIVNLPLNAISNLVFLKQFEKNAFFSLMQGFDLLFGLVTIFYISFVYSMKQMNYENIQLIMVILLNILTVFSFLRIILCLTVTKAFGPVFQALQVIFFEVAKFMNVFIAFLMLFSLVGFIVFNQMPTGQFGSFIDGLYFLIEAMFAQFSFQDFSHEYPAVGYIFMIIYLYSYAIVFLNVLVAILTFNFEITNRKSRMLHYQHTIFHVRQGNYIQKHGCLIVIPIFLEFIIIPYLFLKYILSSKSTFMKALQNFYINLSYIPILILSLFIGIVVNLFLLPFAYVQHAFLLFKQVLNKIVPFSTFLKWIVLGNFFMLKQLFYEDTKEFCQYLCSKQSHQDKEKQQQKKIVFDETFRIIFQTICNMYVSGITYCTISELFNQIKEDMQNQNKFVGKESCIDEKVIVGVHLLKRRNLPSSNSPNMEQGLKRKPSSTPLQLHILQRKNSIGINIQRIDKINVKQIFQGVKQMEDVSEHIFEYFQRFCFKDIARNEEQRDQVINLHNLLKLHEHYTTSQLRDIIHTQLYKTIKLT